MPEILLPQLQPNTTYTVQLRSTGRNTLSEWSPTFTFTTGSDSNAPAAPTNLTVEISGGSMILKWTPPTVNEDGTPLRDLDFYEVVVTSPNSSETETFQTLSAPFDFDAWNNRFAFAGVFQGTVDFAVYSVDTSGNRSIAPATIRGTKSRPAKVTNLTFVASESDFIASWTAPAGDVKDFEVSVSDGTTGRPYYTTSTTWTFTREENVSFFGSFRPNLTVTVKTRDGSDQLSDGETAAAGNVAPNPPTITRWESVGTSFVAEWTAPTTNSDGSPLTDLRGYELSVIYATTNIRKFIVDGNSFIFSLEDNRAAFAGTARSPLTLEVRARDSVGQLSEPDTEVATNPPPATPQDLVGTEQYNGIFLDWKARKDGSGNELPAEDDLLFYEVWVATGATGATATGNLFSRPLDSSYTHQTVAFETDHYFYVRAVDVFGTPSGNSNRVGPLRPRTAIQVDTVAPGQVGSAGMTVDASLGIDGSPTFLIRWDPVPDPDNDLSGYKVRFSTVPAPDDGARVWSYAADVAPDDIVNSKVQTTITSGLHSGADGQGQLYEVQVRAYDFSANYGPWIGKTATTPAGGTSSDNVAQATQIVPGGYLESSNYQQGVSGWRLTDTTLDIEGGTISSEALQIQFGNNIAPAEFAGFEFVPDFYTAARMARTATNVSTPATGSKYEVQYLQFDGNGDVYLSPASNNYNIPIEPSTSYIFSWWAKSVSGTPTNAPLVTSNSGGARPLTLGLNSGVALTTTWTRYSARFTTTAADTGISIGFRGANGGSIGVDGVQVERRAGNLDTPSFWKPPGLTRIDGSIIRTGEIRSTTFSPVGDTTQPAWSLNMQGNMQINDGLVRGRLTVGGGNNTNVAISSANYGTSGVNSWAIKGDGTFDIKGFGTSGTSQYVVLDANGLRANNGSRDTFNLNATTGAALFQSASGSVQFDGSGLRLYSGATLMVDLNNNGTATFTGEIKANSGYIGNWSISTLGISAGSLSIRSDIGQIFSGSGTTTVGMRAGYGFWAGASDHWNNAPFRVDTSGFMYSISGNIGGFVINGASGLYSGSGTSRVQMQPNSGFWAGADARDSAPFRVTQTGALTATNATISGTITSSNANITGYVYATSGQFKGTVYGDVFYSSKAWAGGTKNWIEIGSSGSGDFVDEIRMYNGNAVSSIRNPSSSPGGITLSVSSGNYCTFAGGNITTNQNIYGYANAYISGTMTMGGYTVLTTGNYSAPVSSVGGQTGSVMTPSFSGVTATNNISTTNGAFFSNSKVMVSASSSSAMMYWTGSNLRIGGTSGILYVQNTGGSYIGVYGGAYSNQSSKNIKKEIKTMKKEKFNTGMINRMNPVTYILDEEHQDHQGNKVRVGFVAEEMQQVLPEVVNADPQGNLGIDYASMTAVLVQTIKELSERIEILESSK